MASNMLTGDRRWGQTRKSGMTVLGKVPKPINLPSQRLENHGLDPNVEIVPKGTLTWGSRPSLTASNAWGSSSLLSPNTEGSHASPSSLSGRPSSGGSYTRPSTSASDRSHQAVSSAWGPNSRPSSASGILLSNQTSAAVTRPRSAETRPGSSQFSCFVEPVAESVAWGATRTAEKLVSASKSNSFTLSSGDFPTLGSEKSPKSHVVQQGHSSQGRPASASGRVSVQQETMEHTPTVPMCEPSPAGNQTIIQLDKGNVSSWRRDNSPYSGSAVPRSSGDWHKDQQQMQTYPHANVPSQPFESWLGPPVQSAPDGIWYRGRPPGGVCRPGGPPGSYPVESYVYYPHLPAQPLSNSQSGPRHGAVAGGYVPMNGAPYRPRTPDSYMVSNHPIGPMRPEVFPRQMHYENYCGPPILGNEQDSPVLGVAPYSSLSNQHPNQNLNVDSGNFHAMPCYYAPSMASEQAEDGHAHESNGLQYKVLLKQHDSSKDGGSEGNKDQCITDSVAQLDLADSRPAQKKGSKDEPAGVIFEPADGSVIHPSAPTTRKNVAISTKSETVDDHCANTSRKGDSQRYPVKRGSTLIEKIESLNNKARLADGRSMIPAFVGEEKNKQFKSTNTGVGPTKEDNTAMILPEKSSAEKVSFDGHMENKEHRVDSNPESTVDVKTQLKTSEQHTSAVGLFGPSDVGLAAQSTHKMVHSKQNRADYHAKSRFNGQDVEEWKKKSPGRDSSVIESTESCPASRVQDNQPCQDASEKKEFQHTKAGDEKYFTSSMDPADYKAQHDKMKEIARQRAKQLQKEEDDRIREQKARALAKLEELNRRTLAESSDQTLHPPSTESQSGEDARTCSDLKINTVACEAPDLKSTSTNAVVHKTEKVNMLRVPAALLPNEGAILPEELVDSSPQAALLSAHNDPPMSLMQDSIKIEGKADSQFHSIKIEGKADSQFHGNSVSKQKQMPHKRQDNYSEERHVSENVSIGVMVGSIIVGSKSLPESAPPSSSTGDVMQSVNKDADGHLLQHKKRNNRTTRNKNRLDEASSIAILQSAENVCDVKTEGCKPKSVESMVEGTPVLSEASNKTVGDQKSSDVSSVSPNQGSSEETGGAPSKSTVPWRPQPPKRVTRNPQATKSVDKFHGTDAVVWAPVKSTNKEPSEVLKVTNKTYPDSSSKSGSEVELNLKSKRAEMERYVPKPIAKEHLQQENLQQPSSPCHDKAASGSKADLGSRGLTDGGVDHSVKVDVPANTKNGENSRPNRHGRAHASWRRRGPPESSSSLPCLPENSSSFDSNKDTQKASCLQQPSKHDDSQKEQSNVSVDGWNDDNNHLRQCEPITMEKDHAKMNRGRRQPFKGHKVVGNSCSSRCNWDLGHGRTDKGMSQMMSMEADESAGRKSIRNENQNASGHPRSQWQPKLQTCSTPNLCQETMETGQRVTSQGNRFGKESSLPGGNHDQPVESKCVSTAMPVSTEIRNARHHEVRRERRVREESFARRSPSLNQESAAVSELVPQNGEAQNEPVSSGTRWPGQRSGWLARGHEPSSGGDDDLGQDPGKHNLPANVARRRQYQRTGYYDKQNDSFQHNSAVSEEAQNFSESMGKYRERGHNHARRAGHFYSQRTSDAFVMENEL